MSPEKKPESTHLLNASVHTDLSIAELLKSRRKELDETLEQVEKATKIRKKYLELIEVGDYEHLPDDVYSLGYVKAYADYLGFETNPIIRLYKKERMVYRQSRNIDGRYDSDSNLILKPLENKGLVFSSKTLLVSFALCIFLGIVGYLGWQVAVLAAPPKITLNSVQDKVSANFVIISGQTDIGADMFINGSPILTNGDGSFSEHVALVDGSNQIRVSAKNKLGKETEVIKTVTATLSHDAINLEQLTQSTIDGVEVLVKISNQATWLIVQADGKDVFRGTVLPNTQQIFRAKTTIKLTTGNAGNTNVVVTNNNVSGKDLGAVGKAGDTKLDLEFGRDTQFQ